MIQLRDITKQIGNRIVLDHVTAQMSEETVTGFQGINGSGKSTTFNIVGSLMSQSAGSVFICGYDALLQTGKARAKLRYCPQSGNQSNTAKHWHATAVSVTQAVV